MSEKKPIMVDDETARLFAIFVRYKDPFAILMNTGMFESSKSQWRVCFTTDSVLTDVRELISREQERVAYRR